MLDDQILYKTLIEVVVQPFGPSTRFLVLPLLHQLHSYVCYPEQNSDLPQVQSTDNDKRNQKVDNGGGHHHVEAAGALLIERDAAPRRLHQYPALVGQVVHLGEEGPRRGRKKADHPDHCNHFLCLPCRRPGDNGRQMARYHEYQSFNHQCYE